MKMKATHLRGNRWAVQPEGTLGVCGWIDKKPWTVDYINARSAEDAIKKVNLKKGREDA